MNAKRKQCGQLAGQAKTGYDECMNGDKEKFLKAGMSDYVAKPVDMEKLQTNNYNIFQEMARPFLLKYLDKSRISFYICH